MAEYIEREEYCEKHCRRDSEYCDKPSCPIWKAPAADVAPVVHGRWVIVDDGVMIGDGKHMECSVCHTWNKDRIKADYCQNCGARMEGEGKDNG